MQNISTIYRFNTPFLDIKKEKDSLINVKNKIKDFIKKFESIQYQETRTDIWEYIKITLIFENNFGEIDFYYVKEFRNIYYMPIFKMDIFLWTKIIETQMKVVVGFLTNIYECFDGLTEKEYLIDMNNTIYYKNGIFSKVYPDHQFSDLDIIQEKFEKQKWTKLFEAFLIKFSDKKFVLNINSSWEYHTLHAIILYYIYLVHIMYKNIIDSNKQLQKLENLDFWEDEAYKKLVEHRLSHVNNLSVANFNDYYKKLEVFFSLFE